jgi:hypothetical protein
MGSQFTSMLLEGFPMFCIDPLTKLESLHVTIINRRKPWGALEAEDLHETFHKLRAQEASAKVDLVHAREILFETLLGCRDSHRPKDIPLDFDPSGNWKSRNLPTVRAEWY